MPLVCVLRLILACLLYALAKLAYLVYLEIFIDAIVIIGGDGALTN
jgi:hypothetical protein